MRGSQIFENIMAISALFDISIDDLLSNERGSKKGSGDGVLV